MNCKHAALYSMWLHQHSDVINLLSEATRLWLCSAAAIAVLCCAVCMDSMVVWAFTQVYFKPLLGAAAKGAQSQTAQPPDTED